MRDEREPDTEHEERDATGPDQEARRTKQRHEAHQGQGQREIDKQDVHAARGSRAQRKRQARPP
jgi:hypothetical protein